MYNPFPMEYGKINFIEGHYNPSSVKFLNNYTFNFWLRSLFQRACSTLEFKLPDTWKGPVKDFFYWVLFRTGHLCVFKNPEFGYIFQPCTLSGYNVWYQPTNAIVSNPKIPSIDKSDLIIGKDTEIIKLTPDYMGIWDIICYYAEELANLKSDLDMASINSKSAFLLGAKTRAAGEALRKMVDNVSKGNPAIVYDMKICNDQQDKDTPFQYVELPFDKATAALDPIFTQIQNTLNAFDNEIGIPTVPYQKKERMVVSEAESKTIDSTSRSLVWFNTLKDSIDIVNEHFSDEQAIEVTMRFPPVMPEDEEDIKDGEENV